jgi:hypothetical protein
MDYEGIKTLLQRADTQFTHFSHLRLDAGNRGEDKGKDRVQKTLGWNSSSVPEEVLKSWAREKAKKRA